MSIGHGGVDRSLEVLRERGLVRVTDAGTWSLTPSGLSEAGRLSGKREEGP
jgi:Mn-dependent DtxR family transcriptional regulator